MGSASIPTAKLPETIEGIYFLVRQQYMLVLKYGFDHG